MHHLTLQMTILAIVPGKPKTCLQENVVDCADCGDLNIFIFQVIFIFVYFCLFGRLPLWGHFHCWGRPLGVKIPYLKKSSGLLEENTVNLLC